MARAALPFVLHLRWGWHRVERAMERGQFSLDAFLDHAYGWCVANLPVEPVCLGEEQREVVAIDSSTIARLRAVKRLALAGKGSCHRAGRAVRVGLVRRTRFGASCQEAVQRVCSDLPPTDTKRRIVVAAGMATTEQFAAATAHEALLGRLRINAKLRGPPAPPTGNPGRPPVHGAVLHPGRAMPELAPDGEATLPGEQGDIWLRRWNTLHYEEFPHIRPDVVRVDDPAYNEPLVVGTTAREWHMEEFLSGYQHRWPVATHFFVAQDTAAMEMPRAWAETALVRRISAADQYGADSRVAVEGHCGGLRTAGDRAVGLEACPV